MSLLQLLRIKHWIKNLLVMLPAMFAGQLLEVDSLLPAILATIAFCLASSAVYVFNDLKDMEADRIHLVKRERPLASGAIPKSLAIVLLCALASLSLVVNCLAARDQLANSTALILGYLVLNACYSCKLKAVPVADVASLALGFLLRVIYGGAVCGVVVSSWLFLTVLALSFWLALGKRRGELSSYGSSSREVLGSYTESFLTDHMNVFLGCGLSFYALWAAEHGTWPFTVSVFLAMLVCLRYGYVASASGTGDDPVENLLGDKMSLALITVWAVCLFFGVYG